MSQPSTVIRVVSSMRHNKLVSRLPANSLIFTKSKDRIIITLDDKKVNEFEDREGFLEILCEYLKEPDRVNEFIDKMNQGNAQADSI